MFAQDQRQDAPKVALVNPSGWGNLGDAAIIESAIAAVRRRMPGAEVVGLTLNPTDTARRHRIQAFTCSGFSRPYYHVTTRSSHASPDDVEPLLSDNHQSNPDSHESPPLWMRARDLLRRSRVAKVPLELALDARSVVKEFEHRAQLDRALGPLACLIVAGGGQLDDYWGGAFGHPYVLWRWMRHARSQGAKGLVLSVGTGTLRTPLARYFVHEALSAASYRSFRDPGSRDLVGDPRVSSDPIVPDLAFALPVDTTGWKPNADSGRPLIGFSPIAYYDPDRWPFKDEQRYRSYLERMAALGVLLLAAGYDLALYGTDSPDIHTCQVLREEIMRRAASHPGLSDLEARVQTPEVTTLGQLFDVMSRLSVVIASRLHAVILAQIHGIPTGALAYERKVSAQFNAVEAQEFCLPIDTFNAEEAFERFNRLFEERSVIAESLRSKISRMSAEVEAQYDRVLGAGNA